MVLFGFYLGSIWASSWFWFCIHVEFYLVSMFVSILLGSIWDRFVFYLGFICVRLGLCVWLIVGFHSGFILCLFWLLSEFYFRCDLGFIGGSMLGSIWVLFGFIVVSMLASILGF